MSAMRPVPMSEVGIVCQNCGRELGSISNYAHLEGLRITLSCPCGGSTQPVEVGDIYQVISSGVVAETSLRVAIEKAIERARRPGL
jgi:hypothetical protein